VVDNQEIVLRGVGFDDRTVQDLARVRHFTTADIDHFKEGVASGHYNLLAVEISGQRRGTLVLSWDYGSEKALFCNVLAAEHVPGADLIAAIDDMCCALAREHGAKKFRFCTYRPGLVRICEALGFKRQFTMEKAV